MTCAKGNCDNYSYRASAFCLDHLNEYYESKGETKCRNKSCSNMADYFGLCGHCDEIYQQGKNVMKNRGGSKGKV